MASSSSPSPPGILVPRGGSCCANCMYVAADGTHCKNRGYVQIRYKGKRSGDPRFIDGKTGLLVPDPFSFCCNLYDWTPTRKALAILEMP